MSNSTKAPYFTHQHGGKKLAKRLANKRVRKAKIMLDGGMFKYVSCSYDISDYSFYWPEDPKSRRK
jgi:hypothetical protein